MAYPAYNRRPWWSELGGRGVVHVTGIYLVSVWLIVQLANLAFGPDGPWPLPQEVHQLIWIALILNFPIVLVFGWRYDITREGFVRTDYHAGVRKNLPLSATDHAIIAGLSMLMAGIIGVTSVGVLTAVNQSTPPIELPPAPAAATSIAVLPFTVCSGQESDEVLAAGLAAEVIDRLAAQGELKVVARASSFTMASGLSLPNTDEPPDVEYLLSGEICREGGVLTLRAELSDATGYVVWRDSFEQTTDRSGNVTVTLATRVAEGVGTALSHAFPCSPN